MLVKSDRATMRFGLEQRVPILDHRVVEFSQKIPPLLKMSHRGLGKEILRSVMGKYLPSEMTSVKKQGFNVPLRQWLRGDLQNMFLSDLNYRNLSQIPGINAHYAHQVAKQHVSGVRNHESILWSLYCLIQWMKHFRIDGLR